MSNEGAVLEKPAASNVLPPIKLEPLNGADSATTVIIPAANTDVPGANQSLNESGATIPTMSTPSAEGMPASTNPLTQPAAELTLDHPDFLTQPDIPMPAVTTNALKTEVMDQPTIPDLSNSIVREKIGPTEEVVSLEAEETHSDVAAVTDPTIRIETTGQLDNTTPTLATPQTAPVASASLEHDAVATVLDDVAFPTGLVRNNEGGASIQYSDGRVGPDTDTLSKQSAHPVIAADMETNPLPEQPSTPAFSPEAVKADLPDATTRESASLASLTPSDGTDPFATKVDVGAEENASHADTLTPDSLEHPATVLSTPADAGNTIEPTLSDTPGPEVPIHDLSTATTSAMPDTTPQSALIIDTPPVITPAQNSDVSSMETNKVPAQETVPAVPPQKGRFGRFLEMLGIK